MATYPLSSSQGKWIMVSTILASAMAFIDGTALNVVLPALQKNLDATGADLFWILNAYLLMLAALMLIGGSLGDKLGRKKIFMLGIGLFMLGSAACGFAANVTMLILFRALQGVGGALMIPGSLSMISSSIDEKERGKAIGTWSAFTTVVTMGGPALGGALADAGLWRYIFFINIPIGIAVFAMLFFKVEEISDGEKDRSIDVWGAIMITLGLSLFTFGFLRIPALGISHWQVYLSLVGGLLFLALFIWVEKRGRHPMVPGSIFKNDTFTGANLLTLFLYAGLAGGMLFLSLNLVQIQGYTQLQSGLTFLPFTVLMITVARFSGALVDKYGPKWLLITGPVISGAGFLLMSFVRQTHGPADYWHTFFPGIMVLGLGMSFTVTPLTTSVMGSVDDHFSGTASGINNAVTRIANVFANAVFGTLSVLFFSGMLQSELKTLPLKQKEKQEIYAEAEKLGDARVPVNLTGEQKNVVGQIYRNSFIHAYANIMRISAGLAFVSAIMAFIFIKNHQVVKEKADT